MKCFELVRSLVERGIRLSIEGEMLRATPPERASGLVDDMRTYRRYMEFVAAGVYRDSSFRGTERKVRFSCPALLEDGRCHGCVFCEKWSPIWVDGEGPSGLCVETPSGFWGSGVGNGERDRRSSKR